LNIFFFVRNTRNKGNGYVEHTDQFVLALTCTNNQVYEQHPFWCTGYTYWDLHSEAPDLFLHLSNSDLVIFKGDLNHRKLTYDCAAPASTPFDVAIGSLFDFMILFCNVSLTSRSSGPMANAAGAPKVCSLRTIKSDVVVGLGQGGNDIAEGLDQKEPGWKISGKYVSLEIKI
jgi:damage-control phosphatase, subfamily III